MKSNKTTYRFKRGQIIDLDTIYSIQGLAGGNWWEKTGNDVEGDFMGVDMGDEVVITRDIEITITIKEGQQ